MKLEILPYDKVFLNFNDFKLSKDYIERDELYHEGWLHIVSNNNDALVYIMPGSTHNLPEALWISVLEVRHKGVGFGTQVIFFLKEMAKKLGFDALALHALDGNARMFYHHLGFCDYGEEEILFF